MGRYVVVVVLVHRTDGRKYYLFTLKQVSLALRKTKTDFHYFIPQEIRKRYRGSRAGAKLKAKDTVRK